MKKSLFSTILSLFFCLYSAAPTLNHLHCRDPDLGAHHYTHTTQRTFLLISGNGAGIGNFLVFFPAAYYFAMLTGRNILLQDGSLIGEMCKVIFCGFPHYSTYQRTFPKSLPANPGVVSGIKAWDFSRHLNREALVTDTVIRADGFKYQSGWYNEHPYAMGCIAKITGCKGDDISCHDRHALQQLIRGPFYPGTGSSRLGSGKNKIIGVPSNLIQGILTLPHSLAPRFDVAVHLRCQFKHFEYLVGPEDTLWPNYLKEVEDFLESTEGNAGIALFKTIEEKIVSEMASIVRKREGRRVLAQRSLRTLRTLLADHGTSDGTSDGAGDGADGAGADTGANPAQTGAKTFTHCANGAISANCSTPSQHRMLSLADHLPKINLSSIEAAIAQTIYSGDSDTVYVYLASDNERVKEAFAHYLVGHANISVMRVQESAITVHAKNIDYLKQSDGIFPLVMDWYAMSLANDVFAWRRDTNILSTFAQRVSGNTVAMDAPDGTVDQPNEHSKGFQLNFGRGHRVSWAEF